MGNTDPTTFIDFGGSRKRSGLASGDLSINVQNREVFSIEESIFRFGTSAQSVTLKVNSMNAQTELSGSFLYTGSKFQVEGPISLSMPTGSELQITGSTLFTGSLTITGSIEQSGSIFITGSIE